MKIVDPTLLGGFVVENETIVIDGSLIGQLDAMRHRLQGSVVPVSVAGLEAGRTAC
jgi:hypothetical protein